MKNEKRLIDVLAGMALQYLTTDTDDMWHDYIGVAEDCLTLLKERGLVETEGGLYYEWTSKGLAILNRGIVNESDITETKPAESFEHFLAMAGEFAIGIGEKTETTTEKGEEMERSIADIKLTKADQEILYELLNGIQSGRSIWREMAVIGNVLDRIDAAHVNPYEAGHEGEIYITADEKDDIKTVLEAVNFRFGQGGLLSQLETVVNGWNVMEHRDSMVAEEEKNNG